MPGHVIRGTPIAVDLWDNKKYPQAKLFFLTNFHADHIAGLTDAWKHPIYTSAVTCKLLVNILGVNRTLIHPLEINQEHLILMDTEEKELMSVTAYDANHCPGAIMILLCGYFGNIFYTGNFRYDENILDFSAFPDIDALYLDNTYCSPKCVFPSYDESMDAILQKLHACLQRGRRVFIGMDNLGKEDLLQKIHEETHKEIWVNPGRRRILEVLKMTGFLTGEDRCGAKILVVPFNQISGFNIERWSAEHPSCAILPTAKYCGYGFNPFGRHENIHVISLSNHSSYDELLAFVQKVRPKAVVPIIGKDAKGLFGSSVEDRADMSVFSSFISDSPPSDFDIPRSVQRAMRSQNKLRGGFRRPKRKPDEPSLIQAKRLSIAASGTKYIDIDSDSANHKETDRYDPNNRRVDDDDVSQRDSSGFKIVWEVVHVTCDGKVEEWEASD